MRGQGRGLLIGAIVHIKCAEGPFAARDFGIIHSLRLDEVGSAFTASESSRKKTMKATHFTTTRLALLTLATTLGSLPLHAGTTWDGGGAADTNINTAANWDGTAPGVVNALNGTTAAIFATGGNAATMNVPARFTTITFNRNNAGGFAVSGASTLSANQATSGGTINLGVSDTVGNGVSSISSAFQVNTDAGGGNRFLNIKNDEKDVPTGSLLISGGISASTPANTYAIRAGGTGVTVLGGTLSHVSAIQQVNSGTSSGKVIVNGSQALGSATVNIPGTVSGTVSPAYTIQMGGSTADVQSWTSTTINQNATVVINSTATLTGGVSVAGSTGATGATLVVDGTLGATTLGIGSAGVTGNLKIGGSASFSGNVTIGAAAGNLIVGNAATNGTLSLSGGTISANVTLGGANTNENHLNLTKINAGTLALNGTHSYTGATNVNAGTLNLGGAIASPITVNAAATLGGEGSTTGSLTFATGSSALQFDPATPTVALTADTVDVSAAGIVLVSPTAATTPSATYTVLKRVSGSFSPTDLSKFALATRGGSLSITGATNNEITLIAAESTPASLVWKGNDGTNPSFWDVATTLNWDNSGADRFYAGDAVTFDDSGSPTVAVQGTSVSPGNILFNNTTANAYTLSGGGIGGAGSLTKNNSGTATIANSLSHSGGITVNAGVLALSGSSNTFIGDISITGGELQFSGASLLGSLNARPVILTGGTITRTTNTTITNDAQTFAINANGVGIKVDSAANTTWRIGGKISGSGDWIKSGAGVLALGKIVDAGPGNDFTGTVTVTAGTLDVRHGDSLGSTVAGTAIQSAILLMQNFGQTTGSIITVDEPLDFSGASFLAGYAQETKTFTQRFNGPIAVQAGTTLGISTARAGTTTAPTLELNGTSITTGAGSVLNLGSQPASYPAGSTAAAQTVNIAATISGPGALTAQGEAGSVFTLADPEYAGNTTVNSGTLKLGADNSANNASTVSIAASGATLDLNFAGTDTVDKLFIGGVQQAAGVYEAVGNAGSGTEIGQITGSGTLTVTTGPVVSGFATWIAGSFANGSVPAGQQGENADPDNDGASNLVEFAFDGDPTTGANNGKIHAFTVDSDQDVETAAKELVLTVAVRSGVGAFTGATSKSASVDGVTYTIEGSTTLDPFATQVNVVPTAVPPSPATLSSGYVWKSFNLEGSNGLPAKGFLRATVVAP